MLKLKNSKSEQTLQPTPKAEKTMWQ